MTLTGQPGRFVDSHHKGDNVNSGTFSSYSATLIPERQRALKTRLYIIVQTPSIFDTKLQTRPQGFLSFADTLAVETVRKRK